MDPNLLESRKALERAEAKFNNGDVLGAVQMALKAKRLFPNLHGLSGYLEAYRIQYAFDPKSQGRPDWYAVLNVESSCDLETIRKRFKELRSLTHPDKNSSSAAEGAFKLVYKAWEAISKDLKESGGFRGGCDYNTHKKGGEEEEEKSSRSSSSQENKTEKCPDCSRKCACIDSRSTIFECKSCKLIGVRGGPNEGRIILVLRDGFANIDIDGGDDATLKGVNNVNVYGGESILLTRCKKIELKGGNNIHISNSTNININGSGNLSFS